MFSVVSPFSAGRNYSLARVARKIKCLSLALQFYFATAGISHQAIVTGRNHKSEQPQICWINTQQESLTISSRGMFHAFDMDRQY